MRLLSIFLCLTSFITTVFAQNDTVVMTRPDLSGDFEYFDDKAKSDPDDNSVVRPYLAGNFFDTKLNRALAPRVFKGYHNLYHPAKYVTFPDQEIQRVVTEKVWGQTPIPGDLPETEEDMQAYNDSNAIVAEGVYLEDDPIPGREELPVAFGSVIPDWLRQSIDTYRFQEDFVYLMMITNPGLIEYAYWDLPEQPVIPEEDYSFTGYIKRLNLPDVTPNALPIQLDEKRINWLHTFNIGLQLSQAYVSKNWYQGGNSHLSFLTNFLWDVILNNTYYPKVIFQSTASYKLNINSTPDDEYHQYTISQDLFQYNLKAGYKAVNNWYYSFLVQFKTQFCNSYPSNSLTRAASFLSPGELNLGAGLTYSKENKAKTLRFSASISPVSYNLKTCIDPHVEHTQFGIKPDRKWVNDFGSNAEVNFYARIFDNTTYNTRLFLFSDYETFQTDWENTLNFQFSRLFSAQIYAHFRYDTSADSSISRDWRKLMLNEILSVGISYTFSTK